MVTTQHDFNKPHLVYGDDWTLYQISSEATHFNLVLCEFESL